MVLQGAKGGKLGGGKLGFRGGKLGGGKLSGGKLSGGKLSGGKLSGGKLAGAKFVGGGKMSGGKMGVPAHKQALVPVAKPAQHQIPMNQLSKATQDRLGKSNIAAENLVSKPSLRRLARAAGLRTITEGECQQARTDVRKFLQTVIRDSVIHMEHDRRKTITTADVLHASERHGRSYLGF